MDGEDEGNTHTADLMIVMGRKGKGETKILSKKRTEEEHEYNGGKKRGETREREKKVIVLRHCGKNGLE